MCIAGGGGGSPPPRKNTQQDPEETGNWKPGDAWSEGTLGGGGASSSGSGPAGYWKNNPNWDQQWYDKGYKKGDWVSTRGNQSDRTS